ncbi:hypothetical protein PoB_003927400 [Plakobranchus ocellatus]|uniref:Uncharacterized protein n=1 Tax=Plakobranchus ocellatus TaxID=259542 RepID=A0AAV4AYB7_9GAST|nr:hypothetical protein PoB_003927400 [Plakobranchus ocellatus]
MLAACSTRIDTAELSSNKFSRGRGFNQDLAQSQVQDSWLSSRNKVEKLFIGPRPLAKQRESGQACDLARKLTIRQAQLPTLQRVDRLPHPCDVPQPAPVPHSPVMSPVTVYGTLRGRRGQPTEISQPARFTAVPTGAEPISNHSLLLVFFSVLRTVRSCLEEVWFSFSD